MKKQLILCVLLTLSSLTFAQTGAIQEENMNFFSLADVKLLDSEFKNIQDLTHRYLLTLEPDRLCSWFRREAGLTPKAQPYPSWESNPQQFLIPGHILGFYLSSMSMMYETTGDSAILERLKYTLNELNECQKAGGDGYLSAVRNGRQVYEAFLADNNLVGGADIAGEPEPTYIMNKLLLGLYSVYTKCHLPLAKDILIKKCDWFGRNIVDKLDDVALQKLLICEHGSLSESYANVYLLTGDNKYAAWARRLNDNRILIPCSEGKDIIAGWHANCLIQKLPGYEATYGITGEKKFADAALFAWKKIVNDYSWVNGGNSTHEHFFPKRDADLRVVENGGPESCNTVNMLRLTEALYEHYARPEMVDYYEKALINHILAIYEPERGMSAYILKMQPGGFKTFGVEHKSFWCCTGTGYESPAKFQKMIYTYDDASLYVNLFIPSELRWKEKGIVIRQQTKIPDEEQTVLEIQTETPLEFSLKIRHPYWVEAGKMKIRVNDKVFKVNSSPLHFAEIKRTWKAGDRVTVELPMKVRVEPLTEERKFVSISYGPVVLAAPYPSEDLRKNDYFHPDDWHGNRASVRHTFPLESISKMTGTPKEIAGKLEKISNSSLTFRTKGAAYPKDYTLVPLHRLHYTRYVVYFPTDRLQDEKNNDNQFLETERKALDVMTVDAVQIGNEQSERRHKMEAVRSETGSAFNQSWRHATNGGYFMYNLKSFSSEPQALYLLFRTDDSGDRTFDILIDGKLLKTLNRNVPKANLSQPFYSEIIPIPEEMTKGKNNLTVKFQGKRGNIAGGIFDVRIIRTRPGAVNPLIHADLPDMSMTRVGNAYYMSCTTNHMNPGVPVLKSEDLVNWKIVSHCYDRLAEVDEMNLIGGKNAYGMGTWASCIRHHNGKFYVSTFSGTTNKTYIFSTDDPERGNWKRIEFSPSYHDHSLFFEDDGRVYLIWGGGKLHIAEMKSDLTGLKPDTERILIENASAPSGPVGLPAEGSQLFKVNGMYYLFNITWPQQSMRTVVVHRASSLEGPWEGRVALRDRGIAQGGLVDTPDGRWYAYLFRDFGAVGRIPYLSPVRWEDGWPIIGVDGKVPDVIPELPVSKGLIGSLVCSDDFTRRRGDADLPNCWQWNHNLIDKFWSVRERKGWLRLKTNYVESNFLRARNTLTQRTIGPTSTATVRMDVSRLKDGDFAGIALLQQRYGQIGVKMERDERRIVMVSAESENPVTMATIPFEGNEVYLRAKCDFTDLRDVADFYYSLDGKQWQKLGQQLKMTYTVPQFIGYRFALFNYATKEAGGYADFDYFHIEE